MLKIVSDECLRNKLDELVSVNVQKMLIQALEIEVDEFIQRHSHEVDENGHRLVVRNGKGRADL